MNEAKSPAPGAGDGGDGADVDRTRSVPARGESVEVFEPGVVLGELEQAARIVPQARATMATAPELRECCPVRDGLVGRGGRFVTAFPLSFCRRSVLDDRSSTALEPAFHPRPAQLPAFAQVKRAKWQVAQRGRPVQAGKANESISERWTGSRRQLPAVALARTCSGAWPRR